MSKNTNDLIQIRKDKLTNLLKNGINPYFGDKDHEHYSKDVKIAIKDISKEDLEKQTINFSVAGRIKTMRGPFMLISDNFGEIQIYLNKDFKENNNIIFDNLDVGDIVKIAGQGMKTGTGEPTIRATVISILSKSLRPLPEKFHGLKDTETRYRKRYLDLIMNKEIRELFWTRTNIIKTIRNYFDNLGYMEAETPMLQSIFGGAAARPFETHHNALGENLYLRIATELPLKRIIIGGIDRVYEMGRIFRNEGVDTSHNPEFTSIEFYEAYSDLYGMMQRTEAVIKEVAKSLNKETIEYEGYTIDFKKPFSRLNMVESVSKAIGKNVKLLELKELKEIAQKHNVKLETYYKFGHIVNELFEALVEHTLKEPTFVYGQPIEVSPFAMVDPEDKRFTLRAELFILGREYANMFTELNDPIDQLNRFKNQLEEKNAGNDEAGDIDYDFIEAIEYGMPPAGGCGIGIDRLVMLMTGKTSIKEVLLFPLMKEIKND